MMHTCYTCLRADDCPYFQQDDDPMCGCSCGEWQDEEGGW